ncbi:hypothetical protein MMPV_003225 [Pyropia vietnamensis]
MAAAFHPPPGRYFAAAPPGACRRGCRGRLLPPPRGGVALSWRRPPRPPCIIPPTAVDSSGAVTVATTPGTFTFSPSDRDVSVGDTLTLTYTPPPGLFTPDDVVCYAGGFNGWSAETDTSPLLFPAQSLLDGRYRVAVVVPNFARVLDFAFVQDAVEGGVRYDDNGGKLFHIGVVNQLRLTPDGEVQSYVANVDGSADDDADADGVGGDSRRGVDIKGGGGVGGVGMAPVLGEGEEEALHRSRGESALVGEAAGLGNIQISAARDAFERQDPAMRGVLSAASAVKALLFLGFEMDEERLKEVQATAGVRERGEAEGLHMSDFMRVYAELENADEGIEIL